MCDSNILCKNLCSKHYREKYKIDHKEKISENDRKYYIENKDKIISDSKQYYLNHKDSILDNYRKSYVDRRGSIKEYQTNNKEYIKVYNLKNRDRKSEYNSKYNIENRDMLSKYSKRYNKARRLADPIFKLRTRCSSAICAALKTSNGSKQGQSIVKYFPYTMEQLKRHLESQFDDKMSWNNYGSYWHIDHIIPQSLLPYSSMEDGNFKKCWALENLRPLEKIANIKKGNRIL